MDEPKRMGAVVEDRDGDQWRRGRTVWTCLAAVDGRRVRQVVRIPWSRLVEEYGPVMVMDDGERK